MSNMVRWDPFREVMGLRRAMDRLFDDALVSSSNEWQPVAWNLALDVIENDNEYVVKASVPGLKPEDLDITYDNNVLVIKGELKEEKDTEEDNYHLRERRYGSFSRSLTLPSNVKGDEIQASYTDGVLKLQLPKAEESKPKRITIQTGEVKMIDSTAADIKNKN
jgi:HSP20 family protein